MVTQAAAQAQAEGLRAWIAVTDEEANVLALFRMAGAPETVVIDALQGTAGQGLELLQPSAGFAAISKAGTGALLSSGGNAFTTRTASFIVLENFPPKVELTGGGPLFGVQFSSLACTDFKRPSLPLGLAGDPGGVPLYRNGLVVGGVGVEAGVYGVDRDPGTFGEPDDQIAEERSALAGQRGYEAPDLVRADRILADGIRLPYVNASAGTAAASLPAGDFVFGPRVSPGSSLLTATQGGVAGRRDPRFPTRAGRVLTAADVDRILSQAAQQTTVTRAAIRQPLGSNARVSISVVDTDGTVLGFFQNQDAPNFGIDVSVQKARTANYFSGTTAAAEIGLLGLSRYLQESGAPLNGSVAYTSRAVGFLAQPYFPPGIAGTNPGPFSIPVARNEWSPFNTGLQLDLLMRTLQQILALGPTVGLNAFLSGAQLPACTPLARLPNGITIFPGGIPLYKNGVLAGAIGISGDGVDQDDLIAAAGTLGFEAPQDRRSDQLVIRGVRLPYVKFPRHPEL